MRDEKTADMRPARKAPPPFARAHRNGSARVAADWQALRDVVSAAKANPVAIGLVAGGLAALWVAARQSGQSTGDDAALGGTRYEALSRWADDGGPTVSAVEDDARLARPTAQADGVLSRVRSGGERLSSAVYRIRRVRKGTDQGRRLGAVVISALGAGIVLAALLPRRPDVVTQPAVGHRLPGARAAHGG